MPYTIILLIIQFSFHLVVGIFHSQATLAWEKVFFLCCVQRRGEMSIWDCRLRQYNPCWNPFSVANVTCYFHPFQKREENQIKKRKKIATMSWITVLRWLTEKCGEKMTLRVNAIRKKRENFERKLKQNSIDKVIIWDDSGWNDGCANDDFSSSGNQKIPAYEHTHTPHPTAKWQREEKKNEKI